MTSWTMSAGRVRCPWYLRFAHTASDPDRPCAYAEMKRAEQFANLHEISNYHMEPCPKLARCQI
jgi:hypothetical protein